MIEVMINIPQCKMLLHMMFMSYDLIFKDFPFFFFFVYFPLGGSYKIFLRYDSLDIIWWIQKRKNSQIDTPVLPRVQIGLIFSIKYINIKQIE